MDGYAIDQIKAEVYKVITYKSLAGADPAHQVEEESTAHGRAVYITTGAPVPDSFVAVVPIENVEKLDDMQIRVSGEVKEGQFIRAPGSDIKAGQAVLAPH